MVHAPIRRPGPWELHRRQEPPGHLALRTNEAQVQETQWAIGNHNIALQGLVGRLAHPDWPKPSTFRSTTTVLREIHWLIVKDLVGGRGPSERSPETEALFASRWQVPKPSCCPRWNRWLGHSPEHACWCSNTGRCALALCYPDTLPEPAHTGDAP